MLTHGNIAANVEQLVQAFAFERDDRILGILPFFHSFGFTGCVVLPAISGLGVVYHPSPLDARAIGPLVRRYHVTFLLATPTFLQLYVRGVAPEDFGSVRVVLAGAEKLPERVSVAFEERFGIRPHGGIRIDRVRARAITVNTRDFRAAGLPSGRRQARPDRASAPGRQRARRRSGDDREPAARGSRSRRGVRAPAR